MFDDVDKWGLHTPFAFIASERGDVDRVGGVGNSAVLCAYYNAIIAIAGVQGGGVGGCIRCQGQFHEFGCRTLGKGIKNDESLDSCLALGGADRPKGTCGFCLSNDEFTSVVGGQLGSSGSGGFVDSGFSSVSGVSGDIGCESLVCDSDGKVGLNATVGGKNLERNRANRAAAKEKKKKRKAMGQDWRRRFRSDCDTTGGSSDSLRASLEEKWRVENELATEVARRKLEVMKNGDIDLEKQKYRTGLSAAVERNMVSIEKTHAKLKATGNVPEVGGGGFAETLVSGEPGLTDGSISPDSSASMAEFRACQRKLLDAEALNARYQAKTGISPKALDCWDKKVWTDTSENADILDELCPDGYGKELDVVGNDGKFYAIRL